MPGRMASPESRVRTRISFVGLAGILAITACDRGSTVEPATPARPLNISVEAQAPPSLVGELASGTFACEYTIVLRPAGDPGAYAHWTGAIVSVVNYSGPFRPFTDTLSASALARLVGDSVIVPGRVQTAHVATGYHVTNNHYATMLASTHRARWSFRYRKPRDLYDQVTDVGVECGAPPPPPIIRPGRFALVSINGKPLPAEGLFATRVFSDTLTFRSDTSYRFQIRGTLYNREPFNDDGVASYAVLSADSVYLSKLRSHISGGNAVRTDTTITMEFAGAGGAYRWHFRRIE